MARKQYFCLIAVFSSVCLYRISIFWQWKQYYLSFKNVTSGSSLLSQRLLFFSLHVCVVFNSYNVLFKHKSRDKLSNFSRKGQVQNYRKRIKIENRVGVMIARILNKQRQKFQRKHFAPERLPPESKESQPCLDEI